MAKRVRMITDVEDALLGHQVLQQLSMKHLKRILYRLDAIDELTGTFKTEEMLDNEIRDISTPVTVCRVKFMQTMRRMGFSNSDGKLLSRVYSVLDLRLQDEVEVGKCVDFFKSVRGRLRPKSKHGW